MIIITRGQKKYRGKIYTSAKLTNGLGGCEPPDRRQKKILKKCFKKLYHNIFYNARVVRLFR